MDNNEWLQKQGRFNLRIVLDPVDFMRAVRMGGLRLPEAEFARAMLLMEAFPPSEAMNKAMAITGLHRALKEAYDHRWPLRYPEDFEEADLTNVSPLPLPRR